MNKHFLLFLPLFILSTLGAQNTKYGSYALNNVYATAYENSAFGYEALRVNTVGLSNSAFGHAALRNNLDGNSNSALGLRALYNNTSGSWNTGLGTWALINNTTGAQNTAVGVQAMWYNQTGSNNTAVGSWSLAGTYQLNAASNNSAFGYHSLGVNLANQNNAFGYNALSRNTTGTGNAAFGSSSLETNVTGNGNSAFGNEALRNNKTFSNNAFGSSAAFNLETGAHNCAFGTYALLHNVVGNSNTAMGNFALDFALNANNVGLGMYAGIDSDHSNDCTYLGYNANNDTYLNAYSNSTVVGSGARMTASNQVILGNSSVTSIGGFANWTNISDGRFKKDVAENVPGLVFIKKLRPITYHLDASGLAEYLHEDVENGRAGEKQAAANDLAKKARLEKESQLETGFIAQEVESVARELGYDFSGVDKPQNATDLYGLRYAAFTVPLVKAVQELDAENTDLKIQLATLQAQNDQILKRLEALEADRSAAQPRTGTSQTPATLQQNIPNPFHNATVIPLTAPETATQVTLLISNEAGTLVKSIAITERGVIQVPLMAGTLSAGIYFYTLVVDGQKTDTRKMVVTK